MSKIYIPDRGHIIWLDFEPTKGKEIGKYRPAFILSSKTYAKQTGLLICCPISTSIRNTLSEIKLDILEKPSVITTNLIQTLSWQERNARFICQTEPDILKQVLYRLLPLIGFENNL